MAQSHQATYTQGSIFKHLVTLSGTSAVGLFAIFIVDLVDVFFISILGAPELAAAVGFAGIGLFLGASVCIGISIGISTLVAQAIGASNEEDARRLATHGLIYTLLWTVPVTVATLVYAPQLMALVGASGETLDLAVGYFRIVGCSLPVLGFAMAGTSLLRSVGDPKQSMWATIVGGLVNAVLDPIFIFALSMGLTGAAIASVISRISVAGVAMYAVLKKHQLLVPVQPSKFLADTRALTGIALPSLVTNLSAPVSSAYATAQMARFGTDAVAAASVIGRLTPVAFAGLYGLSGSVGPIASQNFGAGLYHRIEETLIASLKFCFAYVLPVGLLLLLLKGWLIQVFDLQGEAADLLSFYTTFIVFSYALFGLQLAANPVMNALRHPGFSTISNISRDLLLAVPLVGLFAGWFGARGVLAGQAVANAIAGLVAFAVALWLIRRVERGQSIDLPLARLSLHHHRAVAPGVQHRGH
ncbi:MAG: MATE family efflux transporter [Pseudomonadota bacterium]